MHPDAGIFRAPAFSVFLLSCTVVIAYANAFHGAFQFDDFNVIVNNPSVHSFAAWLKDLQHGIRPLLKLTYTINWSMGLGAAGFHLGNVLIHLGNTLLVWLLSRHFIAAQPALQDKPALPLLAAMLFALHPANTEAVTYICGRSSSLMALFYLSGLLLYSRGKAGNSRLYLHVLVPLCMLLAMASKETAVTFPAALLLWEMFLGGSFRAALRQQWSSWLLMVMSVLFFLWHDGYFAMMQNSLRLNDLAGNFATQLLALVYLLRQWLAPFWLNIDPDLPVLNSFAGLWPHLLILIFCIYLIILNKNRRPWLSFALLWMLLHLLPLYFLLPRIDVANDRQLYLAAWPLALVLVTELAQLLKPELFKWSVGIILLLLMSLTILRNQDFYTELALWQATVKASPAKARVQNNLGFAYMQAGKSDQAKAAFETALRLDSSYYKARYNLLRLEEQSSHSR